MQNPLDIRRESIIKWKDLAVINVTVNDDIIAVGERLAKLGLKPKDAIHIRIVIIL